MNSTLTESLRPEQILQQDAQFDLGQVQLLKIAGADAEQFLQGQFTCDVAKISKGLASYGAYCNVKGRVQANFILFQYQQDYYCYFAEAIAQHCHDVLKKYAMFSKVELTVLNDWYGFAAYQQQLTSQPMSVESDDSGVIINIGGKYPALLAIRQKAASPFTIEQQQDQSAWKLLTYLNGVVAITPNTIDVFLPHELQLEQLGAISYDKGCYLGQEIIARMHYRGKSKFALYFFTADTKLNLNAGDEIIMSGENRAMGKVVNIIDGDKSYGLASLHHHEAGEISINNNTAKISTQLLTGAHMRE